MVIIFIKIKILINPTIILLIIQLINHYIQHQTNYIIRRIIIHFKLIFI